MTLSYYSDITIYLYKASLADPMRHVPYNELYFSIKPQSVQDASYSLDFTTSIRYLVGQGYVEEEAAYYRLSTSGIDYAYSILYPPPNYSQKSLAAQKTGNALGTISIVVAILGLTFALLQSHPIKPAPVLVNKSFSIPLSVAITKSGLNARTKFLLEVGSTKPRRIQ